MFNLNPNTLMKKQILTLCLCALQPFINAQSPDTIPIKKFSLGLSLIEDHLLFPIQVNAVTNGLHLEYYLGNRNSISLSAARVASLKPTGEFDFFKIPLVESATGYKLQTEYRRYLNRTKRFIPAYILFLPHLLQFRSVSAPNTGYYAGINVFHLYTEINRLQYVPNAPSVYQVDRRATGSSVKLGYMCQYKCGFILDFNFGIGLQYITSSHRNRFIDPESFQALDSEWSAKKHVDNGSAVNGYLSSTFKIGWAF